ncbi:MAG: bifunctional phosphoserine phosphatase/homoserine phosphotransferase ThrH [Gammaproteobacteria bacterium]|nr:bifunctional phosphoserine phosphatase/homoserine phosphotransferase ThrH [Gammaproteobacteria bacterium]
MHVVCLDLEGVLVPEIWIGLAEKSGIDSLRATTRDVPDYDKLMRQRLDLLDARGMGFEELRQVAESLEPLAGAREFLEWLRERFQVVILSDTFYELAGALMRKLGSPTLFCHRLEVDENGRITGYRLRQEHPKSAAVQALKSLNFRVVAVGDSYNDLSMLAEADAGVLFRPPENVVRDAPGYPVTHDYPGLKQAILEASAAL